MCFCFHGASIIDRILCVTVVDEVSIDDDLIGIAGHYDALS